MPAKLKDVEAGRDKRDLAVGFARGACERVEELVQ